MTTPMDSWDGAEATGEPRAPPRYRPISTKIESPAIDELPAVKGALSGFAGPMKLGRYVFLERLGEGGMGVVVAAYDPKLDRKVAIKLIHAPRQDDNKRRLRMEREAQAMAKLSHPNVVTVYEVSEYEGQLFLAMEFVKGQDLREWLRAREATEHWQSLLDVFMQAGQGLAAAHRAGLVHRDFKPENVFIGEDGRVRVGDFGLARQEFEADTETAATRARARVETGATALTRKLTATGATLGTPAYMAPEQFSGMPTDGRTDQFSFCVALWEALYSERPFSGTDPTALILAVTTGRRQPPPQGRAVPAWLRRVLDRGLSTDPVRRFPTMEALLAALRADPTRRRWMLAVVAGGVLAVAGGLSVQRHLETQQRRLREQQEAACDAAGASIFNVWNHETRASVHDGIVATRLTYAPVTAEKIMPYLEAQAEAWREHRSRVCLAAEVAKTLDAEQFGRAVWCLDERQMELAALVNELSQADEKVVQAAVVTAASLPPVSHCTDRQVLAALPSPPPRDVHAEADAVRTKLSQARTLLSAGRYSEGLVLARTAVTDARAIGWPPLTAAAAQVEGALLKEMGAYAEAESASQAAYMDAAKVQAWDVAALAAVDLAANVGYEQARHADGRLWGEHAELAILFAGDPLGLREAARLNALTAIHHAMGEYAAATKLHERARVIREAALGPEHPLVALTLNNLGVLKNGTGAYAEAKMLHKQALAIRLQALGPGHPAVAESLNNLAVVYKRTGEYAKAKAHHEGALAIWMKARGPGHPDIAFALNNLAMVHAEIGEFAQAKALYEWALNILETKLGPEHPDVATTLNNLATVLDDLGATDEAKLLYQRALAISEKALGSGHPDLAGALTNLALIYHDSGAHTEAKALQERALAILEKAVGPEHPDVATCLHNLAAVHATTGEYAEAKALVERALAIREKALGPRHPDVAFSLGSLGAAALDQDRPAEALPPLERAVAIYDLHEGIQPMELEHRFWLAETLARTGGDLARALAEARNAADGFRRAGEAEALLEVEAFLAKHGGDADVQAGRRR